MTYSEDDYKDLTGWLVKNYPKEALFFSEITKSVNDIFQHLNSSTIGVNEEKQLKFKIAKKPETDYLELKMDLPSILFMGGMGNAIASVIISSILPNLLLDRKNCSKCGTACLKISNYCMLCGNKFES